MVAWRIYYGDGSSYDGDPFLAPARNVQVVVVIDPDVGRYLHARCDFYWWDDAIKTWFGGDINGMWDSLDQPGPKRVLFGRVVPLRTYDDCIKRALVDPDFPVKSARDPKEQF